MARGPQPSTGQYEYVVMYLLVVTGRSTATPQAGGVRDQIRVVSSIVTAGVTVGRGLGWVGSGKIESRGRGGTEQTQSRHRATEGGT
jgi:hypothetical protein